MCREGDDGWTQSSRESILRKKFINMKILALEDGGVGMGMGVGRQGYCASYKLIWVRANNI